MKKLEHKIKLEKKQALVCLALALAVVIASGTNVALAEWREPDSPPMGEQFSAPLTAGTENQSKEGYLLLDPTYNPTEATSLNFTIERSLEVRGEGAEFSTPYVYNDILSVGDKTLYADSYNDWVGIGTTQFTNDVKLKVFGGIVQITADNTALSGYSSTSAGVYGDANTLGTAGVYGYRSADDGWAVRGESTGNVGVRGESLGGSGIYASTQASLMAAVYGSNIGSGWAGYFDGRLGSGSDMAANRFLPTNLQTSLIPFTSGQEVNVYDFGNWGASYPTKARVAFDGTYVWAGTNVIDADGYNFYKVRVSDGAMVKAYTVSTGQEAISFDGTYVWLSSDTVGDIYRFNPVNGSSDTVSGLSPNIKHSLTVSSVGGQVYIWATDLVGNEVLKINADTLSFEMFDLTTIGASAPYQLAFDGEYVWVAAQSGHIVRLKAADSGDGPLAIETATGGCDPNGVYFDGEYVWCLQGASGQLKRIWAEDPSDVQHPIEDFGPTVTDNMNMAFDGTYLWVVNSANKLYRYSAADPLKYDEFNLTFQPERMVFDSTYLWVPKADGVSVPKLHKYYSGTGLGHTDLNTVVNLDPASQQAGNINVGGSGEIGIDLTIGADLEVTGNLWGGSDETVSVSGNTAVCATDGYFIKGITLDGDSKISDIVCRGL